MTQISAEVIQASVGPNGIPIYTLRMVYPRFIHAENKTHRRIKIGDETWVVEQELGLMDDPLLSRNAASSRAIPISKMVAQVKNDPAMPVHWGINQAGMQATRELTPKQAADAADWWRSLGFVVADAVQTCPHPLHKQILNRTMEAWQWMTVIVTATDWKNFFHLRCHKDAQPEIKLLAELAEKAIAETLPFELQKGELHVPFVERVREEDGLKYLIQGDDEGYMFYCSPEDALKVSASCAAQTSFRALDYSLDKAINIYDKLVESKPVHASPFEHQAIALPKCDDIRPRHWQAGITHMDRDCNLWSGNLRGWIQNRQLINGHEVRG